MAGRAVVLGVLVLWGVHHHSRKVDSWLSPSLLVTQAPPGQAWAQCQKELSLPKMQNYQNLVVFEKVLE